MLRTLHACCGGRQAVYRDHPLAETQSGTPAHPPAPPRTQLQTETPRSVARAEKTVSVAAEWLSVARVTALHKQRCRCSAEIL